MKEEEKKDYSLRRNLKLSLRYAKKQKKYFILYFIFNILLAGLGAVIPMLNAQQLLKLTNGLLKELLIISGTIFLFEISRNFCNVLAKKFAQVFAREISKKIQIEVAEEVLKIETSDLDKKSSGVFIDRMVKDTGKISDIFLELNMTLTNLITNLGILVAIFVVNKIIFIYYVISIAINFFISKLRINVYNKLDKRYRKNAEQTTGLVGELVRGVRDVKVLNASKSFMNRIGSDIDNLNQERYNMGKTKRFYFFLGDCAFDILEFILIGLGIYLIYTNKLSIASFIIVYTYRHRVFTLLELTGHLMEWVKEFNLSAGRVFEIINSDEFKKEKFGNKHIDKIDGDFEFKSVHFSYNEKQEVLKGISFKVKHNQTVSFVGKSGAGKSTIFSLLAKLYEPTSGNILIDGIDISELDCDSIRGNISIITQNPYIFNLSIRDNFMIVKDDLTEEEMIEACKLAKLHDFIMSLPDGYDTIVGEGGLMLSGGQRQRLAIARALAQKTEIILFDEATSALDNETQKGIQEAINNMKNEYTILIIAHRLSTVINSDKIMIVDDGKITAEGTHEELLKTNKEYKRLYDMELKKE